MKTAEELNQITELIIGCAIEIHRELGPGLLESAYRKTLAFELQLRGLGVQQEVPVPLIYKGHLIVEVAYRMDLLVEDSVVVECKCLDAVLKVHGAQLKSHLVLAKRAVGLLINWRELVLTDGIKRVVNNFPDRQLRPKNL